MAIYQSAGFLSQQTNADFNTIWEPGSQPKYSGIYKCVGCGHEVVAEKEENYHLKIIINIHRRREASGGSLSSVPLKLF